MPTTPTKMKTANQNQGKPHVSTEPHIGAFPLSNRTRASPGPHGLCCVSTSARLGSAWFNPGQLGLGSLPVPAPLALFPAMRWLASFIHKLCVSYFHHLFFCAELFIYGSWIFNINVTSLLSLRGTLPPSRITTKRNTIRDFKMFTNVE